MIVAKLLKKGDDVISVSDTMLAIKRSSGEVDMYRLMLGESDDCPIYIDPVKVATIGYGDGSVEKTLEDGTKIISI